MENANSKRTLLFVLLLVIVAAGAYGLGVYTTGLLRPAATEVAPGASSSSNEQTNAPSPGKQATRVVEDADTETSDKMPKGVEDEFSSFWQTFNAIEDEFYYSPVDREKMINGAAKGMVEALGDDYSTFLDPVEQEGVERTMEGNFEGIGAYIGKRNDLPIIISPIPNTPAERAGIRARDIILAVDGRDVTELNTDQIAAIIRGPAGTEVRLTLSRDNKAPFELTITRARIDVPAVTLKWVENDTIAHLEVNIFNNKTTFELDNALKEIEQKKAKGIILDLRNNGGGWVLAAQEMLGRFLPEGKIAFYESRKADGSDDRPQYVIANGPKVLDTPLVVLVNGGSASASELVSGALQDHGRAKLIGEQTFGKGSEQHVHTWKDGSSARITFAHWLTPKKRDINPKRDAAAANGTPAPLPTFTPAPSVTVPPAAATATAEARPAVPFLRDRGLTPDIEVLRTEKDFNEDKDPQLVRAVEYAKSGK